MVITVQHGVTIHGDAEASVVQQVEFTEKAEVDKTLGMVSGVTQVVKMVSHTKMHEFSVTGKGALTLAVGTAGDPDISYISGGVVHIGAVKLTQKLGTGSEWNYTGEHAPSAS
jgi:hypothetical protein